MFRLVLAQNRYQKAAGEWNEWPDSTDVNDRGGLGISDVHRMKEAGGTFDEAKELINLDERKSDVSNPLVEEERALTSRHCQD